MRRLVMMLLMVTVAAPWRKSSSVTAWSGVVFWLARRVSSHVRAGMIRAS